MLRCLVDWVAAPLAFHPPRPASYTLKEVDEKKPGFLAFADGWKPFIRDSTQALRTEISVHMFRLRTSQRQQIVACFFRVSRPRMTVLYAHGNATDIGAHVHHHMR